LGGYQLACEPSNSSEYDALGEVFKGYDISPKPFDELVELKIYLEL
jgi:hypothetical protein